MRSQVLVIIFTIHQFVQTLLAVTAGLEDFMHDVILVRRKSRDRKEIILTLIPVDKNENYKGQLPDQFPGYDLE